SGGGSHPPRRPTQRDSASPPPAHSRTHRSLAYYRSSVTERTYWKVPFEWTRTVPPPADALAQHWSWLNRTTSPELIRLVADVLANSPGPEDCYAVEVLGADDAARRTLALAPGFRYLPDRWHVLSVGEEMAGFVLPVIYDDCSRDGL